jgi:hypothetical protein
MVIREAESIINDPLFPCHSRRLGMTVGAALANKIAGLIILRGKRNVKINPMLSSAITLNMIVLFFKKGLLLHFCDFVVITQLAFVLYMKARLCIVLGSINYILYEEHFYAAGK